MVRTVLKGPSPGSLFPSLADSGLIASETSVISLSPHSVMRRVGSRRQNGIKWGMRVVYPSATCDNRMPEVSWELSEGAESAHFVLPREISVLWVESSALGAYGPILGRGHSGCQLSRHNWTDLLHQSACPEGVRGSKLKNCDGSVAAYSSYSHCCVNAIAMHTAEGSVCRSEAPGLTGIYDL